MLYGADKILRDVRVAMDENRHDGLLVDDRDQGTLDLDTLIRSKVEETAEAIMLSAPLQFLNEDTKPLRESVFWDETRGSETSWGWLLLPEDFLRIVVFRMSDWERPVCDTITIDDPRYAIQKSRYAGLRGCPQRPVVAIVNRPEGLALEFYSCRNTDATIALSAYVAVPRFDHYDGIVIPERLYRAVVEKVAVTVRSLLSAE